MDPGIFKAIFLAGGPGSGKSTAVRAHVLPQVHGLKVVNTDDMFELLMKKSIEAGELESMDMKDDSRENRIKKLKMFNKSRSLTKKRKEMFVDGRLGVVIDGTGGSFGTIRNQKKKLEDLGYETFMLYVDTTLDTALKRNIKRGEQGGRRLRDEDVARSWSAVDKNKQLYIDLFKDNIAILDGNDSSNPNNEIQSKKIRKFIVSPVTNQIAAGWIDKETEKRSPT